jgi:hypothetical protein
MRRYYWLSILSGCAWAAIAYILSFGAFGSNIIGGLVASPLIGLLVGIIYRPAYKLSKVWQVFLSLGTLYLAVAMFGLAAGFYDAFWRAIPNRGISEVIFQMVIAAIMGITITGFVVFLWPLAYFNHKLLGRNYRVF